MSILRRVTNSTLIKGSLLMFIGNNVANFGNFLYNLFMGRLLGPEKYGELGAILSIMILISLPLGIFNLLLVKIISSYWGKKEIGAINSILVTLTPHLFFLGLIFTGVLLLSKTFLLDFLNLENFLPIIIVSLSFVLTGPSILARAALTGTLSFSYMTLNSLIETTLKVVISVVLVYLNFQLVGALLGPIIGGIVVYLLTLVELKAVLGGVKDLKKWRFERKMFHQFFSLFLGTLALTAFITVDIILVRHFFPSPIAGEYTALSTIGKIIYFIVGPVITVMFPVISSRASGGLPYIIPLLGTLVLSLGLTTVVMVVYFLFPQIIIGVLFGSKYFDIIPYLGIFSFFMTIYTINSILTHFLLSISYYRPIYPLFLISLLQGFFIFIFHDNIWQVIWVNTAVSILYLITISFFVAKKEGSIISKYILRKIQRFIYAE